jgi:hypothetical protein
MHKPTRRQHTFTVLTVLGMLVTVVGATTSAAAQPVLSAASRLSLKGCSVGDVPAGFVLDASHSGSIRPSQYSASGDIQASLIYDRYQRGQRNVFTQLSPTPSSVSQDLVIECVAMKFDSSSGADRFLQSFEYLRSQAGKVAKRTALPRHLPGRSVAYQETQQAFSGYQIASTDVVEAANQRGDYFYDVSVAGPAPKVTTAFELLKQIASPA